jgi:hypothetical protein
VVSLFRILLRTVIVSTPTLHSKNAAIVVCVRPGLAATATNITALAGGRIQSVTSN